MTTKPVTLSSKSSSTPHQPLMTPIPSATQPRSQFPKEPSATPTNKTRGNDIQYLQVQERMWKYEIEGGRLNKGDSSSAKRNNPIP